MKLRVQDAFSFPEITSKNRKVNVIRELAAPSLVAILNIWRHEELPMTGIGGMPSSSSYWSHVLLKTTQNDDSPITPKVFMLPKISRVMPVEAVASLRHFPHTTDLELADPHFDEPGKVYLLLDNDVAQDIVLPEFRRGAPSEPFMAGPF